LGKFHEVCITLAEKYKLLHGRCCKFSDVGECAAAFMARPSARAATLFRCIPEYKGAL
jgi:hypothetical protein